MARFVSRTCSLSPAVTSRPPSASSFILSSRNFSNYQRCLSTQKKYMISSKSNEKTVTDALDFQLLPPHSRWALSSNREGIQRLFRFKTFKSAWSFMDRVASECKTARHHPEWANVYNTVFVRWTTHEPRGLSEKDVAMAMFCDEHAAELGEVTVEDATVQSSAIDDRVQTLMEGVGKVAGDCCQPQTKT